MKYLLVFLILFASSVDAAPVGAVFLGKTGTNPSLRECMNALEKGNLIFESDETSVTKLAYKGRVYFIQISLKGMRCAYFEPTHKK
jgi:hypothetical protein